MYIYLCVFTVWVQVGSRVLQPLHGVRSPAECQLHQSGAMLHPNQPTRKSGRRLHESFVHRKRQCKSSFSKSSGQKGIVSSWLRNNLSWFYASCTSHIFIYFNVSSLMGHCFKNSFYLSENTSNQCVYSLVHHNV